MAPPPDCLLSLVGLSAGTNSCFPLPTDPIAAKAVTDSATGKYLDTVEGLRLQAVPLVPGGPATDLWDRLAKVRAQAVALVRAALEAGQAKSYGVALFQQRGTLGGSGNGQLAPVGTPALLRFYTNYARSGAWRITKLSVYTNLPLVAAPLLLDGAVVATIDTDAKGLATGLPAAGFVLPLDGNEHTLEVVLPAGVRVYTNKLYCFGCHAGSPWAAAVKANVRGWDSSTLGNGLSFFAAQECTEPADLLCYAIGSDYSDANGPVPRYVGLPNAIALAIQYKAAELFCLDLLANQQRSRYTMLEPKALDELIGYYQGKQAKIMPDGTGGYLPWLNSPEGLGQVQHPCYVRPTKQMPGSTWTL